MKLKLTGFALALSALTSFAHATIIGNLDVETSNSSSALANALRGLSWNSVPSSQTSISAGGYTFNKLANAGTPTAFDAIQNSTYLSIEGIYSNAAKNNSLNIDLWPQYSVFFDYHLLSTDDSGFTNKTVTISSISGTQSVPLAFQAGDFGTLFFDTYFNTNNVWSFSTGSSNPPAYYLFMLEDTVGRQSDNDFNDMIVLVSTLSAVPEPSTIVTGIAVLFLGFTVFRHRRRAAKAAVAA